MGSTLDSVQVCPIFLFAREQATAEMHRLAQQHGPWLAAAISVPEADADLYGGTLCEFHRFGRASHGAFAPDLRCNVEAAFYVPRTQIGCYGYPLARVGQ